MRDPFVILADVLCARLYAGCSQCRSASSRTSSKSEDKQLAESGRELLADVATTLCVGARREKW